ncbi:MAG: hypothetical protein NT092_11695 [Bacteroidia bacterium]|nr:hypothetical protein [Bacteroidia bacterium]
MMKRFFTVLTAIAVFLNLTAQEKFTDTRDGNIYKTIKIEGVTWMAENLKYIAEGSGAHYFDNDPGNLASYGVLYEWQTAMKVCPDSWHLPSGSEFRQILDNMESSDSRGNATSGPVYPGFQLAGMKSYEGVFTEMDESGYYWTSTEYDKDDAEFFSYIFLNGKSVVDISRKEDMPDIHGAEKTNKYSVRCVKNEK